MNFQNDVRVSAQRKRKLIDGNEQSNALSASCRRGCGPKHRKSGAELIENPHKHDVLCGRGGYVNNHKGNVAFRRVVDYNKETYHTCKKQYKILLSRSIVEAVQSQNPPGRFLQKDKKTGKWIDIGYDKAVLKASQALREGAEDVRKQIHRATRVDVNNDATESVHSSSEASSRATRIDINNDSTESVRSQASSTAAAIKPTIAQKTETPKPTPRERQPFPKRIKSEQTRDQSTAPSSPSSTSLRTVKTLTDVDDVSVFSKGIFNNLEEEFDYGALMGCDVESVGDGQRSFVPPTEGPVLDAYMGIPLLDVKPSQPRPVLHVYAGVPLPSPPPSPQYSPATTPQTTPEFDEEDLKGISDEIKSVVSLDHFEQIQDDLSLISDEVLLQKLIIATHNSTTSSPRGDGSTQEVWEL